MNRGCSTCNQPEDSCNCRVTDTTVYALLQKQTEMLTQLAQQNSYLMAALTMFSEKLDRMIAATVDGQPASAPSALRLDDTISVHDLEKALCGGNPSFTSKLTLQSSLPSPAFKDRAFSLSVSIQPPPSDPNEDSIHRSLRAKLFLFTAENPPKMLRTTTLGEKIIKGDTEVENEGCEFHFRKVVVKEVTSHFPNGSFFLVVALINQVTIKPLIIDKFIVKARKILGESETKKRSKIEDSAI